MLICLSSLPQENTSIKRQGTSPSCSSPRSRVQWPAWRRAGMRTFGEGGGKKGKKKGRGRGEAGGTESGGRKLETRPHPPLEPPLLARGLGPCTSHPQPPHTPCPPVDSSAWFFPRVDTPPQARPPSVSWGPVQLADDTSTSRSERASERKVIAPSVLPAPRTSPSGNRRLCHLRSSALPHP